VKGQISRLVASTIDASAKTTSPLPAANVAEAIVIPVGPATSAARSEHQNSLNSTPRKSGTSSESFGAPRKIKKNAEDETPSSLTIHLDDASSGAVASNSTNDLGAKLVDADIAGSAAASDIRTRIFVPASTLVRNAIASPPPAYPSLARGQRVEGDVLLQAYVDERGRVETVVVVNGPEILRSAAMDA
jgi:protein TonB